MKTGYGLSDSDIDFRMWELDDIESELNQLHWLQQNRPLSPDELNTMGTLYEIKNRLKAGIANANKEAEMKPDTAVLYENMAILDKVEEVKRCMQDGVLIQKETLCALVYDLANKVRGLEMDNADRTRHKIAERVMGERRVVRDVAGVNYAAIPPVYTYNPSPISAESIKELMETQGVKNDSTKPDFSLLSPIAITYLATVLSKGAIKYDSHNWRKGIDKARLISASLRHLMALLSGISVDEETGLPHSAHIMCNMMFLCELETSTEFIDTSFSLSPEQQDLLVALLTDISNGKVPPLSAL